MAKIPKINSAKISALMVLARIFCSVCLLSPPMKQKCSHQKWVSQVQEYIVSVSNYKDCYPTSLGKDFFDIFIWFYAPQREGFFVILPVSVCRCIACYPTTIDKDFLLWFVARSPPMRQKCSHLKRVSQVQEQPLARQSTLW